MTRLKGGALSLALALASALAACGDGSSEPGPGPESTAAPTARTSPPTRVYERGFAFVAELGDSLLMVPWILRTDARPDSVAREARGWLARGGFWEAFYAERWTTPPTRAPGRILPHGDLGFVVRDGDIVDGILFQSGPRNLELAMGEVLAAWVGPDGETFDLMEGSAYFQDQRLDGVLLDVSRSWSPDAPAAGDWALLLSGDSVRLVLAGEQEHEIDEEPTYRAWAQRGQQDLLWPEVRVRWTERQAFPPARRDVPTAWSIASTDGTLTGTLRSVTAELEAGEGEGPLLPVRALIEVEGTITTEGGRIPVRGILVHQRR